MRFCNAGYCLCLLVTLFLPTPCYSQDIKALEIQLQEQEQATGRDSKEAAQAHVKLGDALSEQMKLDEAEGHYVAAALILSERLDANNPIITRLVEVFRALGHDKQSQLRIFAAVSEKYLGDAHEKTASALMNLGDFYISTKQLAEAEVSYKHAIEVAGRAFGQNDARIAAIIDKSAQLYAKGNRLAEAVPLLQRHYAILEEYFGPASPRLEPYRKRLFDTYSRLGLDTETEVLLKHVVTIHEQAFSSEHSSVILDLRNLAFFYQSLGRYPEAEGTFMQVLRILEKTYGKQDSNVAGCLMDLATVYADQGQYTDAESLYKRSLGIYEKQLGSEHITVATGLHNLAGFYSTWGRNTDAESLLKRSLAIYEKQLGPDAPQVIVSLNALAGVYIAERHYGEAESVLERSLAAAKKRLGLNHPDYDIALNNLAGAYLYQKRYAEAEDILKQSLANRIKLLGQDDPNVAVTLFNLAGVYDEQGRYVEAMPYARQGFEIYRKRNLFRNDNRSRSQALEPTIKESLNFYVALLFKYIKTAPSQKMKLTSEAYEASQLMQSSSTGDAVTKMSARLAHGTDDLAIRIRNRQDVERRLQELEVNIRQAVVEPTQATSSKGAALQEQATLLVAKLNEMDSDLDRRFPDYIELSKPKPISLTDVAKLLNPSEAIISYVLNEKESFLFIVTPNHRELLKLEIGRSAIESSIQLLRQRLNQNADDVRKLRPFDVAESIALYEKVFAPAEPYLTGAKHVMLVLDGALESIPYSTLVSEMPKEKIKTPEDHRKLAWLAKRFDFTTLPSVSSLRALRTFSKRSLGDQPFIGFGDPTLDGRQGAERGRKNVMMASLFNNRGAVADVDAIRQLDPLPDTAEELKTIAKALKANDKTIFMQNNATETNVKRMDLAKVRVLAFSTHGAMAGELKGYAEPGLILTPPKDGTELDDGYLSASEIAQLKLNADWVLLSACNTAAADGKPGAEGLSGLAKAFFYAGARSLLVSHWPVDSDATRQLVTNLFSNYTSKPGSGKAEALNQAALGLMNDPKNPHFAHPYFWAPFVVAGEGGISAKP